MLASRPAPIGRQPRWILAPLIRFVLALAVGRCAPPPADASTIIPCPTSKPAGTTGADVNIIGVPKDRFEGIRAVVFAVAPLQGYGEHGQRSHEPWKSYLAAQRSVDAGRTDDAIQALRGILAMPDLQARHHLQAWLFLRRLGIAPPDEISRKVYGVVVETVIPEGLEMLVAYSDCTARYYNRVGQLVQWEAPDDSLNTEVNALIGAARRATLTAGPWEGPGPPPVPARTGEFTMTVLTPGGLRHLSPRDLASDNGEAVLGAATPLLVKLVDKGLAAHRRAAGAK